MIAHTHTVVQYTQWVPFAVIPAARERVSGEGRREGSRTNLVQLQIKLENWPDLADDEPLAASINSRVGSFPVQGCCCPSLHFNPIQRKSELLVHLFSQSIDSVSQNAFHPL